MERFDLVNEQDEVIGQTDKLTSHEDGGIHRVVAIFVFDKDGRLYVQEHLKSGGLFDHSVGGHVRQGETYDDAAKREGQEELGLFDPLHFVTRIYSDESFCGRNIRHMFGIYECFPDTSWQFISNSEVKNIRPVSIKEIVADMNINPVRYTPGFLNTMREYLKAKNVNLSVIDYRGTSLKYH
jgi:isopentenyldiphosphate isomerase